MSNLISYCAIGDVEKHIKRLEGGFTDTSKVTKENVLSYIDEISRIVDGELRELGISIPIGNTATVTLGVLKTLVSLETASWAEEAVYYSANKREPSHSVRLHERYEALLTLIKKNPAGMLSDVVSGSTSHMKSSTEDMNEGEVNEGDEVFTKKHIDDFRDNHKIPSESEERADDDIIDGAIKLKI